MNRICITFRSITLAQRAQSLLRQGGVETRLQRTPRTMEQKGCGYCLRLYADRRERATALLDRAKIPYRTVENVTTETGGGR